jgi:small neutral amino acid transporter SnatA (MarC family)
MIAADLFVGSVAMLLGTGLLVAAAAHWSPLYRLPSAQRLTRYLGCTGARVFHGILGLLLIGLGLSVLGGWDISPFR